MDKHTLLQFILATIEVRDEMIWEQGDNPRDYDEQHVLDLIQSRIDENNAGEIKND